MRLVSILAALVLAGVCLAAQQEPPSTSPAKEPAYQGKTLGHWTMAAKSKKPAVRVKAAMALGNIGPTAVPALTGLLKDEDSAVRSMAAGELGFIGPQACAAVPILKGLLYDKDAQRTAAIALGQIGPGAESAVPALIELFTHKNFMVQQSAVIAVGQIGPGAKMAVPALIEVLKDEDAQRGAATSLGQIGPAAKAAVPSLIALLSDDKNEDVRYAAAVALVQIGPEVKAAVPVLIEMLGSQNDQRAAAEALDQIGPGAKAAIPALTKLLRGGDSDMRQFVASILGRMGPEAKAAVPALTKMLSSQDDRGAAVDALGQIGPGAKTAVPALAKLLRDADSRMRQRAASSLGRMGPEASVAVPALTKMLSNQDDRGAAVDALGQIGPGAKTAVPALVELLQDKDLRSGVISALSAIGPAAKAAVPALAQLVKDEDDDRAVAALALGKIGPEAKTAIPVLAQFLNDKDQDYGMRQLMALVLAQIGPAASPTFMELLKDQDEQMQSVAAWGLGQIGPADSAAVPALTALLAKKNASLRQAAARALGQIGPQANSAVPALVELLKDKEVLLRWAAAKALGQIGPKAKTAAAALAELLKDANREVRLAAASALGRSTAEMKATKANVKRIKKLIAELAMIDSPDFGFSYTVKGGALAPVASLERAGAFVFTAHGLKRNDAFTSLVELGPTALPFLLEALDDKTPTKLTIDRRSGLGVMWLGHEISGNQLNMSEAKALAGQDGGERSFSSDEQHDMGLYTVKVGNVCFVAIGQITNRPYMAVHCQPTGCIVISSTVEDQKLAAAVRAIWGKSDHRQKLLESLLVDFQTRGQWPGDLQAARLGDLQAGAAMRLGDLQAGAAMRLAYYFPEAAEGLILARFDECEAAEASDAEQNADPSVDGMLKAVSWSNSPRLHAKVLEIFRKTTAPTTLLACLPALGKEYDELVFRRITEQLDALPKNDEGPQGDIGRDLLIALGNRFSSRAENVFQNYLKPGTIQRREDVIYALRETCGDLAIPLLGALLDDKRARGGQTDSVNPAESGPHYPIRVCDEAAETIARHSKTLKFHMEGSREDSDRQIAVMRQKIAAMKPAK